MWDRVHGLPGQGFSGVLLRHAQALVKNVFQLHHTGHATEPLAKARRFGHAFGIPGSMATHFVHGGVLAFLLDQFARVRGR